MIAKKRLLIITDSFIPNLTMNGGIMRNIIDELIDHNRIDVISIRRGVNDLAKYGKIKIDYVTDHTYLINIMRDKIRSTKEKEFKIYFEILLLLVRCYSAILRIVSPMGLNIRLEQKLEELIGKKLEEERYDYIMCIGVPFESFCAVIKVHTKCLNSKIIGYQVDDFITAKDSSYPFFLMWRRNYNREIAAKKFLGTFHKYFVLESVYQKEKRFFEKYKGGIPIGLPLIVNRRTEEKKREKSTEDIIRIVYTGSLTKRERTPRECIQHLLKAIDCNCTIEFYHRGDCDDIIDKASRQNRGIVINHGTVPAAAAYRAMNQADFLISISTFAGDQISGKTFDYISTGKPVMFFYYNIDDKNLEVFRRYKWCLCVRIKREISADVIERISLFIKRYRGKTLDFDKIEKVFRDYTPKEITEMMFRE